MIIYQRIIKPLYTVSIWLQTMKNTLSQIVRVVASCCWQITLRHICHTKLMLTTVYVRQKYRYSISDTVTLEIISPMSQADSVNELRMCNNTMLEKRQG